MLSKEKFIEYLERYKELADIEEKLNSAVKLLCPDFNSFYLDKHSSLILDMLKDLINDTEDWIGYYIYEISWGKHGKNCITHSDNTTYSLTNYDELYEYLSSNN